MRSLLADSPARVSFHAAASRRTLRLASRPVNGYLVPVSMKRNPATKLGEINPCGSPWSRLRAERKWSLKIAARVADIPHTTLCEIETGTRSRLALTTLQKLAKLYDLTLEDALRVTDQTAKWRAKRAIQAA